MAKYSLFHGTRRVSPAGKIQKIYHGNKLIWERFSEKFFCSSIYESAYIFEYGICKNGMISPYTISDKVHSFGSISGYSFAIDFSSDMDIKQNSGKTRTGSGSLLMSDAPLYALRYSADDVKPERYIEISDALSYSNAAKFSQIVSDSERQWGTTYGSTYYSRVSRLPIIAVGENGLYAVNRPLVFYEGDTELRQISYVKDGKLIDNAGFSVLAVCGENLVCVENPVIDTDTGICSGKITQRKTHDFSLVRTLLDNAHVFDYKTLNNPKMYSFNIVGDLFVYAERNTGANATHIVNMKNSHIYDFDSYTNAANFVYVDGVYYAITNSNSIFTSTDGENWTGSPIDDGSDDAFSVITYAGDNEYTGRIHAGSDGYVYIIASTDRIGEPGGNIYKLLKIKKTA